MIILLILVGIVSLVYSIVTNESVIEAIVIFGCVLVNAFMGFFQELKSENTIEALRDLTVSKVKVKRDENFEEIDATKLVVGDVILLEAGDKVPADARIIKAVSAKVDESILTGESIAVEKHAATISKDVLLQERKNIVYSGTSVVNGRIEAVIIATGMDTEIGSIAGSLDKKDESLTPLQVKVKKVSNFITVIACILIALTLCYGLIKKLDAISIIMLCISMVLASVPEVLPVSITATLTIGVQQMAKRKTVVKQLAAIETLGATQIICSDKTGTITTNQMTLVEIYANDKTYSLSIVVRHIEFSTVLYQKLSTLPIFAHLPITNTPPINYMQRCITIAILKKDIYSFTPNFPSLLPPRDTSNFNTSKFPYEAAACLQITANCKDSHWRVAVLILHIRTHSTIQIVLYLFKIPISSGNDNVIVCEVVLWLRNKMEGKYDDSHKIINIHDQFLAKRV